MAGNEWINGYLEAILDAGTGAPLQDKRPAVRLLETGAFNATKYFVKEVVTRFDETDLYRTWIKVIATRNTRERDNRLENMCWRIWHLARRKKRIEWDDGRRLAKRRTEREQGRRDATKDMPEDLSEGEKAEAPNLKIAHSLSDLHAWSDDNKGKRLYIVLVSLHGLIRGENMELGRDSDTGGQVKYVVELARALAMTPGVYRVDLLTRQICSPDLDWSYGEPTEMLISRSSYDVDVQDGSGESCGAYIIRIPCGPRDKYIRKELLWPHIQEFADGALAHILNMSKALGEQLGGGKPIWPYVIHGHYADAGNIVALLSGALNVPMVLTGHSLGRSKFEQLLKAGKQSKEEINAIYKIMRRTEAEELCLDSAELVITSTKHEIEEQWGLYDGYDVKLEKVLRARARRGLSCHGRYMPRMAVIPPGMDFSNVIAQDSSEGDGDFGTLMISMDGNQSPRDIPTIWSQIMRFFTNPHKPMILALSRPDPKKNVSTLVKAFGECRSLRELANLTLILGNRDDVDEMPGGSGNVLTTILKLIDKYDLYGQVAYPKHHRQSDVPEIYRLAAKTKGVFINPALVEPFGLTLIEAAAHGLPVVATKNGGPVDIHKVLNNGLLVDPHNQKSIADALLKLVADKNLWNECRKNGLKNIHLYSWPEHCRTYLSRVALCRMRHPLWQTDTQPDSSVNEESMDFQDPLSLSLSLDGERSSLNNSVDGFTDLGANGNAELGSHVKRILSKAKQGPNKCDINEVGVTLNNMIVWDKLPALRKRRRIFVIAVDCYDQNGKTGDNMLGIIQEILKVARSNLTGIVFSTALTIAETVEMFSLGSIKLHEFDALICSSGSEVYYPWRSAFVDDGDDETKGGCNGSYKRLCPDPHYTSHIGYRWGGQGLRRTMERITSEGANPQNHHELIIVEDAAHSNAHCFAYTVKDSTKVQRVDDLHRRLRMRGLRCHLVYCRSGTQLNIIPLLASRSQALRYLFIRWDVDLANTYVFVGETGDTDYEKMIYGLHKTIILKDAVGLGSEKLHSGDNYDKYDAILFESPNVVSTKNGYNCEAIIEAFTRLGRV